jgi:putative membrane protein
MLADSHSGIPAHSILAALGAAALLAIAPGPAAAQPGAAPGSLSPARLSRVDETLLRDLARGNLAEVAAGKLALDKAQDAEVKAFAQTMVDDHGAAMKELEQLAQSKSVKLPTQPTGAQISMVKGMESLRPGTFDKLYLTQSGVTDHRKTLALLKRIQGKGKDAELKTLAAKMQPTVEQHLQQAVKLAGK